MPQSFNVTAEQSANQQTSPEVWLVLLTIEHSTLSEPLRFVNNNEEIVSNGDTYMAFPFEVELPSVDPDNPPKARLRIDNVSREIIATLRTLNSPPKLTLQVILASTPDLVEVTYTDMSLRDVDYDIASISGELVFESIFTEPCTYTMTPSRFPGLF